MSIIHDQLQSMADARYAAFQRKLIPAAAPETIIGVRTPALRQLAKSLYGTPEANAFLSALPHAFFEENQLHAFLISLEKDFNHALQATDRFLPYVDNWATCDQLSPKVFRKDKAALRTVIYWWMASKHPYTVRFGIKMLMEHFLDEDFTGEVLETVASVRREEYYIRMMQAWFFATALAKQYDAALPYLQQRRLGSWVHAKTIQKAVESDRITPEQKSYLKTLRQKKGAKR